MNLTIMRCVGSEMLSAEIDEQRLVAGRLKPYSSAAEGSLRRKYNARSEGEVAIQS